MSLWAYDIECEGWDQYVVGCAACEDGRRVVLRTKTDAAEWYLGLPKSDIVLAHFGGGYDFLQLIHDTPGATWLAKMAGSTIVSCRAVGHAECRDSSRMFPLSLAKWTEQKSETGLVCECGEDCGGFCAIRRDLPAPAMRRLTDYCMQDCVALIDAWTRDIATLQSQGFHVNGHRGTPRLTFGSVAWATAAYMADLDTRATLKWGDYDAGRRAYYGGRTEVGRTRAEAGHRYDVNSMYPWALTHPVPHGPRRSVIGSRPTMRLYRGGKDGLYHGRVFVPPTDIPPLPHRAPGDGRGRLYAGRLLWATGHIEGWWALPELQAAERHGAQIHKLTQATVYRHSEAIFEPFVRHVYGLRRGAIERGDKRWSRVLKWLANSLTGKLAQRPEVSTLRVLPEGEEVPPADGTWHWVGGRVWSQESRRISPNARPAMAAYLTARSRVKLLDRLKAHEGRWLYCDTDSTYLIDRDDSDVHDSKLGSWAYEGSLTEWRALAPKLYRYRDGEDGSGHVRARGVPRASWDHFTALERGETVSVPGGVSRLKSSGGRFVARVVTRTHRQVDAVGTRSELASGVTVPLHRAKNGDYIGAV